MSDESIDTWFGVSGQPCWFDVGSSSATLMAALRRARLRTLRSEQISYHDTTLRELAHAGLALSVVRHDSSRHQLLETIDQIGDDEVLARTERSDEAPGLGWVIDQGHGASLQTAADSRLERLFGLQLDRREYELSPARGLMLEITVLAGYIELAQEQVPVMRIAVSRRAGPVIRYLKWLKALSSRLPLVLSVERLARRGLRLAGVPLATPTTPKAPSSSLLASSPVAIAAAASLQLCALQAMAMQAPLVLSHEAEPVHQFRVALRRLRSLVRFYQPVFSEPRAASVWKTLREDAGRLASSAAQVRECDVFGSEVLDPLQRAISPDVALLGLRDGLERLRGQRHRTCAEFINSSECTRFFLALACACEQLATVPPGPGLSGFARTRLLEFSRRLRRRVRTARDASSWHRARIACKDLRYAIEATASVLRPGKNVRAVLADLARLQEHLGQLEDRNTGLRTAEAAATAYLMEGPMRLRACSLVQAWCAAEGRMLLGQGEPVRRQTRRAHACLKSLTGR